MVRVTGVAVNYTKFDFLHCALLDLFQQKKIATHPEKRPNTTTDKQGQKKFNTENFEKNSENYAKFCLKIFTQNGAITRAVENTKMGR